VVELRVDETEVELLVLLDEGELLVVLDWDIELVRELKEELVDCGGSWLFDSDVVVWVEVAVEIESVDDDDIISVELAVSVELGSEVLVDDIELVEETVEEELEERTVVVK
jgi:hypothetical protein